MNWTRNLQSLRGLLQVLLALAVLAAPVSATAMDHMATTSSSHHEQTSASMHCSEMPDSNSKQDNTPADSCCGLMCMGVAVNLQVPAGDEATMVQVTPVSSATVFLLGSPNELATPPPRLA